MAEKERDIQYGLILIVLSVVFQISALDLLQNTMFSGELSSLLAFICVAIGAYMVGKSSK